MERLTGAPAGNACCDLGELAEDAALGPPHLAATPAGGAGVYRGAWFVAGPGASLTPLRARDIDLSLGSEDSFFEAKNHLLLQVTAPLGFTGSAAGNVAKEGIEDVSETSEDIEPVEGPVEAAIAVDTGVAVGVVLRPFPGVGQYLVGFVDLFKLFFRAGAFVPVRVILHRHFTKSLSYPFVVIGSGNAQNLIVVSVGHVISPVGVAPA